MIGLRMLARQADVFVEVEGGDRAPVEIHRDQLAIEQQRRAAGGEAEHGIGFVAQQAGDDAGGDVGRGLRRGLNDDFHQDPPRSLASFRRTSSWNRSMKSQTIVDDVQRVIGDQRSEIHAEDELGGLVGGVGVEEGRVGRAAAEGGEIVAFAAGDLGIEHAVEGGGQVVAAADVHEHLVGVRQPVEIAPDLAADHLLRALVARQFPHRLRARRWSRRCGCHVCPRGCGCKRPPGGWRSRMACRSFLSCLVGRAFDRAARIVELDHRARSRR